MGFWRKIGLLLKPIAFLCLGVTVSAEEQPDSIKLGEVTVSAVRPYSDIIPAQTLSGSDLEALRSQSVADALRYFSGLQVKDYGGVGGIKTVDMRSMGTNHLGVFYDGIQLGNAQNGQIDLGKFSLDNMEAIDLYNGQKSEIFQSAKDYGSAGTLYLQSRRPRFDEGKRFNANVTFRTGSFGMVNPSVRADWKFSENVSATVSAEYTYATGKYKFRYRKLYTDGSIAWDTTAVRQNGDIHALRLEGGVYGKFYRGYWQAKAYFYDSERGIPGAIVNNVWKNAQRQWDRNFFVQGRYQKYFTEHYALQVNAKYARDYMRYLNPDTTLMYINNRFWQDEVYLAAANRVAILRGWDVNLAVDYQWNRLEATLSNFTWPQRHTLMTALATAFCRNGFRSQGSLLMTMVNDHTLLPESAGGGTRHKSFSRLTPAVFVSYAPLRDRRGDPLLIRAFYKRIFRMPTFNDLYYTDIGNADLKPEYATQWDLGIVWHTTFPSTWLDAFKITADGYYNLINDKIIAVPKGNGQYRWMMMNLGRVKILGVDVSANLALTLFNNIHVEGRLAYTYQSARDYTNPDDVASDGSGTYKGQIAYIPRHSGSTTANIRWRELEVHYSWIYVGERYHNSSNIPENYEPAWYTHDLAASWRFSLLSSVSLKLGIEVNNLFNQQYEVIQNYPMPGRNFKIILSCDF